MNAIVQESSLDLYTASARGIAWDTCHKIYILMDDEQMELMREYEYDPLISSDEMTPSEMSARVAEWYEVSCGLRFIQAVDSNDGGTFHTVVGQFDDIDFTGEEDEED